MNQDIRVRIAPSPTGYVHVGNTYTAYYNYIFSLKNKGRFILRLDDTDIERHVSDAEEVVYKLWHWLGIQWDEGPDIGGPSAKYRQSERLERYKAQAEKLVADNLAYHKEGAIFFKITPGDDVVFQDLIRGEVRFAREHLKDFVIIKSNGYPTYQFGTVVDEIDYNISHVIRGEDHLSNTPVQVLAMQALGGEVPLYAHLPLLRNADHSKLSKRQNHASLSWYKDKGILPEALQNFFGLMGWSHPEQKEVFGMAEFQELFSFDRVKATGPIFDVEKLMWLNGVYIRQLSVAELQGRITGFLQEYQPDVLAQINQSAEYLSRVIAITQERLKSLDEFWSAAHYFYQEPTVKIDQVIEFIKEDRDLASYLSLVFKTVTELENDWSKERLETKLHEVQAAASLKPKQAFMSLRLVLTGELATPPLFDTMEVLGHSVVVARLRKFIELLKS
jgi:glutamyl-tRNA synthetase